MGHRLHGTARALSPVQPTTTPRRNSGRQLPAANAHAEGTAVGWAARRAAYALRTELSPEYVFSAITGRSVTHFHQHVFVRPAGTPDTVDWFTSWSDGPRVDESELAVLCGRLGAHFTQN
ncbi:hypothetical protein [Nocardia uniformis]|uniref:hypothetical protein n=1 Tax=Nocardia uniformis TaxID=53432 RepID=UPI000836B914|nr:hypothetical protein [Nocardia uniformis]